MTPYFVVDPWWRSGGVRRSCVTPKGDSRNFRVWLQNLLSVGLLSPPSPDCGTLVPGARYLRVRIAELPSPVARALA
eukprot:15201950-Alexandrium_andersonii.AAC.1